MPLLIRKKNKTVSTFCGLSPVISSGRWSRMAKRLPAPVLTLRFTDVPSFYVVNYHLQEFQQYVLLQLCKFKCVALKTS